VTLPFASALPIALKVVVHAVPELAGSRSAVITPSVGEAVIRRTLERPGISL
jgi:hypothetical protein